MRSTAQNADRVFAALQRFGAPLQAHGVTAGIDFDEAVSDPIAVEIDGRPVLVIERRALLANKRAAGRPKDLADVHALTLEDDD